MVVGQELGFGNGAGAWIEAVTGLAVVLAHGGHPALVVEAVVLVESLAVGQLGGELLALAALVEGLLKDDSMQRAAADHLADHGAIVAVFVEVSGVAVHDAGLLPESVVTIDKGTSW